MGHSNEKSNEEQIVDALVATIELRDAYTKGHSKRVAHLAAQIATTLGLSEQEIGDLYFGGLVHDLGKIGIPDAVLLKPERLSKTEYEMIQQHSTLSGVIIDRMESWRHLIPLVRHHHERMDGKGYPDGLAGEEIPLGARILAIADIYDALTSRRVYRDRMSAEKAVELMKSMAEEGHIDPVLTEIFLANVERYTIAEESEGIYLPNLEIARNTFFYKDPLTSLFNRNALLVFIKKGVAKGLRISLLKFDIKGFKEINSRFGLSHGDKLLTKIGILLQDFSPSGELMEVKEGDIRACRTMADRFFLLYFGNAVDFFEFKSNTILNKLRTETGVEIKQNMIINNYHADQANSLEWGYLL
ncbi:MAG: HD domain-containing protein [Sulfuricurvum sp.]|jgi:GGDEF domain-containing protein|uniref:HD domain-containing phosphohydrolase n=1 Tax=Sulfuricurvum sp. TaxID=2025608 RepID=UPI0025E966AD|nr:HD domain-containing phosphohydrolase [Sulfuricurvum sp.]MCK9372118.1 HD domain-containing protein [Sulfuricurvum sp.]